MLNLIFFVLIFMSFDVKDIWFFISKYLDGLDVMNFDLDYFVVNVILKIKYLESIEGYGLIFIIGRGNELCVVVIYLLVYLVIGKFLKSIVVDMGGFWKIIIGDS